MDFFPNLLHLVVLCISFSLIFFIYKQKSSTRANFPPGKKGWPMIGETLEYSKVAQKGNPEMFIMDRMSKYSTDLFQTSLFGENFAVFCGASGNKFLFSNEKNMSPHKNSIKLRRVVVEFFSSEALQHFIPIMDLMAKEHLEADWSPFGEVKVLPLSMKYTFALACRLFMSIRDPNHVTRFADPFHLITNGIMSLPINIPGTAYNRAVKAGKVIHQELLANKAGTVAGDLLTNMLLASDENGRVMNDMVVASSFMGLLFAGHHATSSAITFVVKYLAEFPHVYSEVLKEQMEIARSKGPKDLLNWDDIKKMKYSWNVACEAMRLSPPSQGTYREAIDDFTYTGFTIPKGWKIYWTPHSTHKNPEYFPDPEKFDPSRFEGNGPAPYTFVPFVGGPRVCPGS
ncbi:beta-amyrin 28-monooxygenase-like [Fagus crenata]